MSSPDGAIHAELRNRSRLTLDFAAGWYDRCHESDLEHKLSAVATLLWTGRMRRYWEIRSDDASVRIIGAPRPMGREALAYREAREELVAHGRSVDDRVTVSVRGMREWTVRVRPGTVREIDEHEFATAVGQAAADLIEDQYRKIAELKAAIYG